MNTDSSRHILKIDIYIYISYSLKSSLAPQKRSNSPYPKTAYVNTLWSRPKSASLKIWKSDDQNTYSSQISSSEPGSINPLVLGDGRPPTFSRESLKWVYKPLLLGWWVYPLLYGNNVGLDPSTSETALFPGGLYFCSCRKIVPTHEGSCERSSLQYVLTLSCPSNGETQPNGIHPKHRLLHYTYSGMEPCGGMRQDQIDQLDVKRISHSERKQYLKMHSWSKWEHQLEQNESYHRFQHCPNAPETHVFCRLRIVKRYRCPVLTGGWM